MPYLDGSTWKVFRLLNELAERGAPCPINKTIPLAIGSAAKDCSREIARLRALGLIRIERRPGVRRIRIVATNAATGWSNTA